jgi:nicotinate-nucleotide adenylyltransferase
MRLGIYGGSFDPVHNGHLALARACQRQVALDEVWFSPTAIQPLKQRGPHASDRDRVEMLNLAIESALREPGCPSPQSTWRVSTMEIDRGGPSYTVDTLRQLNEELPDAELFFLIGADAVHDVPKWREPAAIFELATLLVVQRRGEPQPNLSIVTSLSPLAKAPKFVNMPLVDASSSEIRHGIAAGQSIDDLVPPAVARYISERGLYRQ